MMDMTRGMRIMWKILWTTIALRSQPNSQPRNRKTTEDWLVCVLQIVRCLAWVEMEKKIQTLTPMIVKHTTHADSTW